MNKRINQRSRLFKTQLLRISLVITLGLIILPLFNVSSASLFHGSLPDKSVVGLSASIKADAPQKGVPQQLSLPAIVSLAGPSVPFAFLPQAQPDPDSIGTYQSDCTTPKSDFALGETVCVRATGPVDQSLARRRVQVVDPEFLIRSSSDLLTSPQTFTFTLPTSATETFNGVSVDNRGIWLLKLVDTSDASTRQFVPILVRDPAHVIADLQINTTVIGDTHPTAGSSFDILVWVFNAGPEAAQNVSFTDSSPANTTFQNLVQPLSFQCSTPGVDSAGTSTCTKSSMATGESAGFIFTYKVNGAIADGTGLDSTATVSSNTTDNRTDSNTSDTSVTGSNPTPPACTITCPSNMLVDANDTVNGVRGAVVTFDATTSGSCGTVTGTPSSGSFFPVGSTVVTVNATGASCSFTVTVTDAAPPTISCPADQTVDAPNGDCSATVSVGTPTTTGTGVSVQGVRSDGRALTDSYPAGDTTIAWTATDSSGRTATCEQTITVNGTDTTAPVPTVASLPTITASCTATADVPTANDNCSGTIGGETSDPRTYDAPGTYTIHWTYTDAAGNSSTQNQTVIVTADNIAPTITHNASNVTINADATCAVAPDLTDQIEATDNCSTVEVTQSPAPGSTLGSGNTTVTFTVTDTAHNSTTSTAVITVVDNTPPTITLNGSNTMTVECHTTFTDPGATANDNCAGATVTSSGAVNTNNPGTYTITYNATDAAGNHATAVTRTVNVVDTTAPVITLNGSSSMTVECHTSFSDPGATASDSCDSSVPVTASGTVDPNVVGVYTITYNASDDSGNAATTVTRTVNVVDTTAPTISCPAGISVNLPANSTATSVSLNPGTPTASDSCSTAVTVTGTRSDGQALTANYPVGTTTITWRATDPSGNYSECTQTIQVSYIFTGFFSPVGNLPTLNNVNAGRTVPLKFSLSGNKGLAIFAAGYPASQQITCDSSAPIAELEGTEPSGGSTLTYSPDQYQYSWQTESSWAGTCRQLVIQLNDGSVHTANFKFR
jgi:hypothetical protein